MSDDPGTPESPAGRTTHPTSWLGLGLVSVLALTVVAMGSLPVTPALLFGMAGAGVMLACSFYHRSSQLSLPLASWVLAALALWSLLQCVPLPVGLVERLSPMALQIWTRAAQAAGDAPPHLVTLSLAPEQSLLEAVKWGGYAAVCWAGHWWAAQRGLTLVCWTVVSLAMMVALITMLHGIFNAQTIFGLYTPIESYSRWAKGPLLNVNHLSAYLALGFYAAVALLLSDRQPDTRRLAILIVASSSLVVAIVALASRAAVASLALGGMLMPVVLLDGGGQKQRSRERQMFRNRALVTMMGVFSVGITLALYGFNEGIMKSLGEKNFSKLETAQDSLPMVRDFWLTGAGRGVFESVFFRYKRPGDYESWGSPENIVIQWTSEWGVPVSILATVALVFALARATGWRSSRSGRLLGLGLVMCLIHNLLDFNLEVPGVAALFFTVLGALTGSRSSAPSSLSPGQRSVRVWFPVVCGVLTIAVALAAFRRGPERLAVVRKEAYSLYTRALRGEATPDQEQMRSWLRRYPADPYLATIAGLIVGHRAPRKAMPWLGWALQQGPHLSMVRLGLADVLARAGYRQQALLEVRLALDSDPLGLVQSVPFVVALSRDLGDVLSAAPAGPQRLPFLQAVVGQRELKPEIAAPLRQHLLQLDPCLPALQEASFRQQIRAIEQRSPPCNDQGLAACQRDANESLDRLRRCLNLAPLVARLEADLLWVSGDRRAAVVALEQACSGSEDLTACLQRVAEHAADLADHERLRRIIRIVVSRRCQGPEACAQAWDWATLMHERAKDLPSALVAITKAVEADGNNLEVRYHQASIAQQLKAYGRAEMILLQILARSPQDTRAKAQLEALRAATPPPTAASSSSPPSPPPIPVPPRHVRNSRNLPARWRRRAPRTRGHGPGPPPPRP